MVEADVINNSLEITAEKLGDFTPNVLEVFYRRFPDAKDYLQREEDPSLEGEMVTEVVYSFIQYLESPNTLKINIMEMVPHHQFLGVPPEHFVGLFESVVEVVGGALPEEQRAQAMEIWQELLDKIVKVIDQSLE